MHNRNCSAARARAHSKAARAVEAASRRCRGDLDDVGLQSSLASARAVRLPRDRIDRAVERGADPSARDDGKNYEHVRYDGMVPAGGAKIAVIIEALTDSRNRTAANVRNIVTKKAGGGGGEMLPAGANDWLFERAGVVSVSRFTVGGDEAVEADEECLLECALDAGATDVDFHDSDDDGEYEMAEAEGRSNLATIRCEPNDMLKLVGALREARFDPAEFGTRWLLRDGGSAVSLEGEGAESFDAFLERLEGDQDVTDVYHNATYDE